MTLEDLDKLLASWTSDLSDMEKKLNEAEGHVAYKQAQTLELAGTTKKQMDANFEVVKKLWRYRKLLKERVDQVKEKRQNLPFVGKQAHIDEMERLLKRDIIPLQVVKAGQGQMFGQDTVTGKLPADLK